MRLSKNFFASVLGLMLLADNTSHAEVVTFGTGSNQFTMEFVEIGNPGNADDTTGNPNPAGSVAYTYQMGKYEVSEDMINKYNSEFGTANSLVISKDARGTDKPATGVSWNEAARFVNWLNTSTGGFAAYKFTTGGVNDNITPWTVSDTLDYDASNPYRSLRATYVLPSMDEWYKAAYYDPVNDVYYDYATGSNTAPSAVPSGTTAGTAVYRGGIAGVVGPADITLAGGLSPYGIMGLGGNAWEWEETAFLLDNNSGSILRGLRGGHWTVDAVTISSSTRFSLTPETSSRKGAFRVASLSVGDPSIEVAIDIKPGSDPNSINLGSNGLLTVVVLDTEGFDPLDVDDETVGLADPALMDLGAFPISPIRFTLEDVNGDGFDDLVLKFSIPELVANPIPALDSESVEAIIVGETLDGLTIRGTDSVRIVPPKGRGKSGK